MTDRPERPQSLEERAGPPYGEGVPEEVVTSDDVAEDHVDILGVRFPRMETADALSQLLDWLARRCTVAVAFPDMSTLNLAAAQPEFRQMLRERVVTLNDGAGLALAARVRRRPFPANLNGTDLCPELLDVAPAGTTVYLVGARSGVAERAREELARRYPALAFVGAHHGYLDARTEVEVIAEIRRTRPQIVMVGMGNPLQVEFIDRHRPDPTLAGTMWLAVGGQLDYYGGGLERAPAWTRRVRLEWLHLVASQPHKFRRYVFGIPTFVARVVWAQLRGTHDATIGRRDTAP